MDPADTTVRTPAGAGEFALTEQQVRFFECFGFLHLPRLFTPAEMEEISAGFEDVFDGYDDPGREGVMHIKEGWLHGNDRLHDDPRRYIIPDFIARSPRLAWLQEDPRIRNIPAKLIGENYESVSSDGSLFFCETSWHPDFYMSKLERFHIKLSLYLEPLRGDSGAIRFLPGTHYYQTHYATWLRGILYNKPHKVEEVLGVRADEIPSSPVETEPGDLVVWNFRIIHASFYGAPRRRLISVNFREAAEASGAA